MDPDIDKHIKSLGLDPKEYHILDPVEVRSWDTNMGNHVERLHYYKLRLVKKIPEKKDYYDDIIKEIKNHKPHKKVIAGDSTLVVALSDWQLGKSDGRGTKMITKRILKMIDDFKVHVEELKSNGHKIDDLYIIGLGDIVEGCEGHYAMQTFSVDLDMRNQVRLAWTLLLKCLEEWAPLFNSITVSCVPGNHGEVRKNGKAFTTFGDNWDVHVFEILEAILSQNKKAYGHVEFEIPNDELVMVTKIRGNKFVFAHGHQFRAGGAVSFDKQKKWLALQSLAQLPADGCDVLLSGHFHHMSAVQEYNTLFLQAPSMDGGSRWAENTHALVSDPGTLTCLVSKDRINKIEVI